MGDRHVDINRTIKLPLALCHAYAADFNGDKLSIYPVKNTKSILECDAYKWITKWDSWTCYNAWNP